MTFLVKDLLITILPDRALGPVERIPTSCDAGPSCCCDQHSRLGGGSCSDPSHLRVSGASSISELAALKLQLKESLAMAEAREKVLAEHHRPKSAEELQLLETFLQAAIEEVRRKVTEVKKA